jgi:hypothetical protein
MMKFSADGRPSSRSLPFCRNSKYWKLEEIKTKRKSYSRYAHKEGTIATVDVNIV